MSDTTEERFQGVIRQSKRRLEETASAIAFSAITIRDLRTCIKQTHEFIRQSRQTDAPAATEAFSWFQGYGEELE